MKTIEQFAEYILKPYIDDEDNKFAANIAPVEEDATSASQGYAVGQQLILDGVLYDVTAAITAGDALATTGAGANISAADDVTTQLSSVKQALSDEVVTRATIGAHNLFSTPEGSGIIAGLTVIKNADESFSVTGGTTSGSGFVLPINEAANYADISKRLKPSTTYKFSVGVSDENMTLQVLCKVLPTDSFSTLVSTVNVSEVEFTTPASFTVIYARVSIPVSTAVPTMTLKPMIRLATDKDDTYLPYAMTNKELTAGLNGNYVYEGASYIEVKGDGTKTINEMLSGAITELNTFITSLTNEGVEVTRCEVQSVINAAVEENKILTSNVSSLFFNKAITEISTGKLEISSIRCDTSSANCYANAFKFDTTPSISKAPYGPNALANNAYVRLYYKRYRKVV